MTTTMSTGIAPTRPRATFIDEGARVRRFRRRARVAPARRRHLKRRTIHTKGATNAVVRGLLQERVHPEETSRRQRRGTSSGCSNFVGRLGGGPSERFAQAGPWSKRERNGALCMSTSSLPRPSVTAAARERPRRRDGAPVARPERDRARGSLVRRAACELAPSVVRAAAAGERSRRVPRRSARRRLAPLIAFARGRRARRRRKERSRSG